MSEGGTEEDDLPFSMKENSVMSVKRSDDNIQCVEKRLGKVDEFETRLHNTEVNNQDKHDIATLLANNAALETAPI